jgi:hypothetical protein
MQARALALVASARLRRAVGLEAPAEAFTEASDLFLKAAEMDPKMEDVLTLDAARFLAEAAPPSAKDRVTYVQRGREMVERLLASPAGTPVVRSESAAFALDEVRILAEERKKTEAKKALGTALDRAAELLEGTDDRAELNRTWYNLLVGVGKRHSLGDARELLVTPTTTRGQHMSFELARGGHWRRMNLEGGGSALDEFQRMGFGHLYAVLVFHAFDWKLTYRTTALEARGDDLEALAKLQCVTECDRMERPEKPRTGIKGKLNKTIPKTIGFEVSGTHEGVPRTIRYWFFEDPDRKRSYGVGVVAFEDDALTDPEIRHVLDTLRLAGSSSR